MTTARRIASFFLAASLLSATPAFAEPAKPAPTPEAMRDARKHFQRGVALFNEADYAGALAEFKKAYEMAPNAAVLYNIGQTHFQLRAYAAALPVFERYLAESGASAEHRVEAEANLETLRTRVGKVDVLAPDGTEVTIDDEVAGKTPLPPIMAAVGRRKITTFKDGSQQVRFAEVAAGETVRVEMKAVPAVASSGPREPGVVTYPPPEERSSSALPTILWVGTGALAAGALTTGLLTLGASSSLSEERGKAAGGTSRGALDDAESKTKTLALVTDILAGAAIVTGGLALYVTLTAKPARTGALPPPPRAGLDLRVGVSRLALEGRF